MACDVFGDYFKYVNIDDLPAPMHVMRYAECVGGNVFDYDK